MRIPLIMEHREIGSEVSASQILSVIPFFRSYCRFFFGRMYLIFRQFLLMIGAILMAFSYIIISLATTYQAIFLGGIFLGIGYPLIWNGNRYYDWNCP